MGIRTWLCAASLTLIAGVFAPFLHEDKYPSQLRGRCAIAHAEEVLESGRKLYSQFNEELIIRDFFNDRREGFFVDVGAAHYRDLSTTYYLEKHLGWSGIAIDALPEWAPGYEKERPKTRFFNYIVTDHAATTDPFYRVTGAPVLSSPLQRYAEFEGRGKYKVLHVPTITLTALLDEIGIEKIDFLSMDIEDSEPQALAGFDIGRFKPELVCIEAHPSVADEIHDYFTRHGYERIEKYRKHDWLNWYYRPGK